MTFHSKYRILHLPLQNFSSFSDLQFKIPRKGSSTLQHTHLLPCLVSSTNLLMVHSLLSVLYAQQWQAQSWSLKNTSCDQLPVRPASLNSIQVQQSNKLFSYFSVHITPTWQWYCRVLGQKPCRSLSKQYPPLHLQSQLFHHRGWWDINCPVLFQIPFFYFMY